MDQFSVSPQHMPKEILRMEVTINNESTKSENVMNFDGIILNGKVAI